jgi:hypothetical protein
MTTSRPCGASNVQRRAQSLFERFKLGIDVNPKSLETCA